MTKREAKYYVDRRLQPPKKFFDWCLSQIPMYKWSNKQETITSADRPHSKVIEKRLTKVSNLTFHAGFYAFTIVLVTSKRIEIQTYCYWHGIINGKEDLESKLANFELFENGEHIQIGHYAYFQGYGFGLVNLSPMGGKYTGAIEYKNSWKEKVKTISELKYLNFDFCNDLYYSNLPHLYRYKFEIEFLQKIKASNIAEQLANNSAIDYRTITRKWLKANKTLLKNNDDAFFTFELKRRIRARGGKVVPGIEKYMNYHDVGIVPKKIGIIRFQNWVIKNEIDMKYYRDYLNMLHDLKIILDNENLIIPKDLTKAHDNAVRLVNEMKREIENSRMEKRAKQLAKLEQSIGEYVFLVPKDLNELVAEGRTLHHCVGGSYYVEGHRTGKTTIVFVRTKNKPDMPFYTLEYKDKSIVQLRGKHNQSPPAEVKAAADKWLEHVNSKKRLKQAS